MTGRGPPPNENDHSLPISVRIPEACRLTGIGRSKLYELIAAGEIEIVKVGSITIIPIEALRQFVERGRR